MTPGNHPLSCLRPKWRPTSYPRTRSRDCRSTGTFFGTVLKRTGNDGPHFTRYLAPKWLERHESMVGSAEAAATSEDAVCPPGQDVGCGE